MSLNSFLPLDIKDGQKRPFCKGGHFVVFLIYIGSPKNVFQERYFENFPILGAWDILTINPMPLTLTNLCELAPTQI